MSSSSNDSEDDEVAKKIRLAVCDESIPVLPVIHLALADANGGQTDSIEKKSAHVSLTKDHFNRNQDGDDEKDYGNILSTTPGFRIHVSKQLCIMLDKKFKESISENLWTCTKVCEGKYKGIHLFSNSKDRYCSGDNEKKTSIIPQIKDSHKARNRTKSSSSESSLDEKISSCVFSQEDITKENALLTGLQSLPCDQSTKRSKLELMTPVSDKEVLQKHKKSKKKRKKAKHVEN